MPTYCQRCHEQLHGLPEDQPHLCKDIKRRLARREKQKAAVESLIAAWLLSMDANVTLEWNVGPLAENIVAKLANMGVEED